MRGVTSVLFIYIHMVSLQKYRKGFIGAHARGRKTHPKTKRGKRCERERTQMHSELTSSHRNNKITKNAIKKKELLCIT